MYQERKVYQHGMYAKQNKRINAMNEVASKEREADFPLLKAYAKQHPVIFKDVLKGFVAHPDMRFGDNLLVFCDCVEHGVIKLDKEDSNA